MIEGIETYMLELSGLFLAAVAVSFFLLARQLSAGCQKYGYAVSGAAGAMAIAYLLMNPVETNLGISTELLRFVGYTVMWIAFVYVMAEIAGVSQKLLVILLGVVLGRVWITLVSWFLDGILSTVATLMPFVLFFVGIYLLYGPYTRVSASTSPARQLLFDKLKHLVILAWIGLIVNGLVAGDALGLVTDFVGQMAIVYVEILLVASFGGLVFRNEAAIEDIESGGDSGLAVDTLERPADSTDDRDSSTAA